MVSKEILKTKLFYIAVLFIASFSPAYGDLRDGEIAFRAGDYKKAFSEFSKLASEGDAEAMYSLAVMYRHGAADESGEPNEQEAFNWYMKAAENGHGESQFIVGLMYSGGNEVVKQDHKKALKWLKKSAAHHNADAEYSLGIVYEEGLGVKKDKIKSKHYYKRAAEHGNITAAFIVAVDFKNKGSFGDAVEWYRKAAVEGHRGAQNDLAGMFVRGEGVKADIKEAIKWYKEAAGNGDVIAMLNLSSIYERGTGVSSDNVEAAKWLLIAKNRGYSDAEKLVSSLHSGMTKIEVKKSQDLADEWMIKHFKYQ